ncbi:MAG: hypothetical protein ABIH83_04095 [Candidatus Micrarchaeota archaeon]
MEYLMTYGWALLVIVIVIAVLMFIRPFGAPESCVFQQPGFSCEGHRITANNGLYARITNGQQKSIERIEIACVRGTGDPTGYTVVALPANYNGQLAHGRDFNTNGLDCGTVSAGEDFSGRLYLLFHYTDDDPGVPAKRSVANIIGPVQP